MKYPFTPEILDALPEELAELFRSLEMALLEEICSRLKIADNLNEVTVQDIRALRSMGIDLEEIKEAISYTSKVGMDKLEKLFDDVVERNQKYYSELVDRAEITKPERYVDATDIDAIRRQTKEEFTNLTQSMGFLVTEGARKVKLPPAKAYQWALDNAEVQIMSGGISYREAIKNAVKDLADSGIKIVEYESGHTDHIDVAVRRAVMTGANQVCQKYSEQSVEYLETDLVEVSAHQGARDTGTGPENHKEWQGKVYRWKQKQGNSKGDYPDFIETTGYGTGLGLGGWNCRHHFYPFYEGVSERTYTDEQLENIDPPPFEYQGKTYTAYEATQKQRMIERTVRKLKREKAAFEKAGLTEDAQATSIRIRRLNSMYKDFSGAAGLPMQKDRIKIYDKGFKTINSRGIINERNMSQGMRKPPSRILTQEEIESLLVDADELGIDRNLLRFNTGTRTGFSDDDGTIHIRGDILPDLNSKIARDRMSQRAVIAHEYYGHYLNDPSEYDIGDWRDEYRASRDAAIKAPNLSNEDRAYLMIDAYDRAREAGQHVEYDAEAKEIIYGYHEESD